MIRLIPTLILQWLVKRDMRLRAEHKKPNRWYWADKELIRRANG